MYTPTCQSLAAILQGTQSLAAILQGTQSLAAILQGTQSLAAITHMYIHMYMCTYLWMLYHQVTNQCTVGQSELWSHLVPPASELYHTVWWHEEPTREGRGRRGGEKKGRERGEEEVEKLRMKGRYRRSRLRQLKGTCNLTSRINRYSHIQCSIQQVLSMYTHTLYMYMCI